MKEMRRTTEPMAHLRREWRSSHTWDTMRSSRPKMAATTAKAPTLRARTMPTASPGTCARLRSLRQCVPVWLEEVQKCQSPKRRSPSSSQWPSQMETEDRTKARAAQTMMRARMKDSKKGRWGLLWASSLWAWKTSRRACQVEGPAPPLQPLQEKLLSMPPASQSLNFCCSCLQGPECQPLQVVSVPLLLTFQQRPTSLGSLSPIPPARCPPFKT